MAGRLPIYAEKTDFRYPIDLSGTEYVLRWRWFDRAASWYLDIAAADGTEIATGIRIIVNFALLKFRSDPDLPAGEFMAFDQSGANLDPASQLDLADRVRVFYFEPGELPETPSTTNQIVITGGT